MAQPPHRHRGVPSRLPPPTAGPVPSGKIPELSSCEVQVAYGGDLFQSGSATTPNVVGQLSKRGGGAVVLCRANLTASSVLALAGWPS